MFARCFIAYKCLPSRNFIKQHKKRCVIAYWQLVSPSPHPNIIIKQHKKLTISRNCFFFVKHRPDSFIMCFFKCCDVEWSDSTGPGTKWQTGNVLRNPGHCHFATGKHKRGYQTYCMSGRILRLVYLTGNSHVTFHRYMYFVNNLTLPHGCYMNRGGDNCACTFRTANNNSEQALMWLVISWELIF